MGSLMLRTMLAFGSVMGLAILGEAASAQSPTVSIEAEYLMTLEAPLDPPQAVGSRLIYNIPTGGSVHGPKINGSIIPPAGDWLIPMADGSIRLDVRLTIKTDDGELVFFEASGVIVPTKEAMDRFNKGEVLTSKDEYFLDQNSALPQKNMSGSITFKRWGVGDLAGNKNKSRLLRSPLKRPKSVRTATSPRIIISVC
jgi:hypothetical protein